MTAESPFVGYAALPPGGNGPGVLVLHAWWGLSDFFRRFCDRLAAEGFVVVAPDLFGNGVVAQTVEEANQRLEETEGAAMRARMLSGFEQLRDHPAVQGSAIGVIGFSLGAAWANALSALHPEPVRAVVLFYGTNSADFAKARADYLGHYAPGDEWEPDNEVRAMETAMRAAGRQVTLHWYEGAGHWFFEDDRPAFRPEAAALAWERTRDFLKERVQ
jgi:carboxymethylenebutenolidase